MYLDIKLLIASIPVVATLILAMVLLEVWFGQDWTHTVIPALLSLYVLYVASEIAWIFIRALWL